MNEKDVKKVIDDLADFKSTTVNFNKDKNICDAYTRCLLAEEDFLKKIKNIKNLQVVKCDFGIFELIIPLDKLETTLNKFVKIFSV